MSRSTRLLEILIALQTKPRVTVQVLADEFGVSRRTMLRDLHSLSELGVPLAATPGPYGGYSLIARRRLLPLSLSVDEAIGIVLSYEALLQYAQTPFAEQSLSAVTKVRNALPADVASEMDRMRQHIVVTQRQVPVQAPLLSDLLRAAVDGSHLRITYDSRSGPSERVIYPYGVYASQGLWYCACYDYRRDRSISLRADRVRSIEQVEGVNPPPPLSLREYLRTRESGAADMLHFQARVTRQGAMSFELTSFFGEIPLGEDGMGTVESEIPRSEIDYFAERFLVLGTDLIVESPVELVDAMREKARAVAELYS